jgi:N-acetylmuramoyl-L-alanine amidase
MKALAVSLFLLAALAADGHVPLQNMNRIIISGSEYIRLDRWAEEAGFSMKWEKRQGTILLSNSVAKMELTVDSRRAEIGGVNVWLSLPVVNRTGAVLLSVVDAETTIEPILFPHRLDARLKTICIDPGHGGRDTGYSDGSKHEKEYSLLLARDVAELLKHKGLQVLLTRNSDTYVGLPDRDQMARREGADLFVSLHYNEAPQHDIRGLEIYCLAPAGFNSSNDGGGRAMHARETGNAHDDQNVLLAYELLKNITAGMPLEDRGMKRSRFEVLRDAAMPAILIEGGFMSNPSDARNIYDTAFRKRMAQSIVDGIMAYKRTIEPVPSGPATAALRSGL